jgi:hypothetical protein
MRDQRVAGRTVLRRELDGCYQLVEKKANHEGIL